MKERTMFQETSFCLFSVSTAMRGDYARPLVVVVVVVAK